MNDDRIRRSHVKNVDFLLGMYATTNYSLPFAIHNSSQGPKETPKKKLKVFYNCKSTCSHVIFKYSCLNGDWIKNDSMIQGNHKFKIYQNVFFAFKQQSSTFSNNSIRQQNAFQGTKHDQKNC